MNQISDTPAPAPLANLRVLDVGRFIAGPYCATLLGDLGADVIRIERPGGGEDRFVVPVTPAAPGSPSGEGGSFLQLARNKRSACLDLSSPAGRRALDELVRRADVIVANLPAKELARLGLDYQSVRAKNPRAVLTTMSAYGETGPSADKTGFDGIGQVMSGAAHLSGKPGEPARWAATYVDYGTALGCAFGTLAALMSRQQTGLGQHVTGSLLKTALTFFNSNLMEAYVKQQDRIPSGSRGQQLAPCDIFATLDGHVLIQVLGMAQFRKLAALISQSSWPDDPRFQTDQDRGAHGELINTGVAAWCATRNSAAALAELAAARIPAERVLSPLQVFSDPHIQAGDFFRSMPHRMLPGGVPVVSPQVNLSATPPSYRSGAPAPGQHTAEILSELGFSDEDIAVMCAAKQDDTKP